jgi:hypothetical protein
MKTRVAQVIYKRLKKELVTKAGEQSMVLRCSQQASDRMIYIHRQVMQAQLTIVSDVNLFNMI